MRRPEFLLAMDRRGGPTAGRLPETGHVSDAAIHHADMRVLPKQQGFHAVADAGLT
jgi:hypothetical protein